MNVLNNTKNEIVSKEHILTLEHRKKLSVSGVVEVISATEKTVVAKVLDRTLYISGQDLRVAKLVLEETLLIVEGVIDAIKYSGEQTKGFFKKVFK